MKQTHLEAFNEQRRIEDEVVKKWGYHSIQQSPIFSPSSKLIKQQGKGSMINQNINPRQESSFQVPKSAKYKEFIRELEDYEYEKILLARKAKNKGQDFQPMKLVSEKINEYNYIIDHKHLKKQKGRRTPDEEEIKNSTDLLVHQIGKQNQNLLKADNLSKQFEMNKKICELYRTFNQKMFEKEGNKSKIGHKQKKISDIRNLSATQQQKPRKNSLNMTLVNFNNPSRSSSVGTSRSIRVNIKDPMEISASLKKNKQLNQQTKINDHKLFVFKTKVDKRVNDYLEYRSQVKKKEQSRDKNKQRKNRKISDMYDYLQEQLNVDISKGSIQKKASIEKKMSIEKKESLDENILEESMLDSQKQRQIAASNFYTAELKKNREKQFVYLSEYLGKKNRKFKKPWGNKILIHYNSMNEAKQMIEGRKTIDNTESRINSRNEKRANTPSQCFSKVTKFQRPENIQSRLEELTNSPLKNHKQVQNQQLYLQIIEADNDDQHERRKCKNQKYNLFLRSQHG